MLLIGGTLISGVLLSIWNYKYEHIMKFDINHIEKNYYYFDYYSEELIKFLFYYNITGFAWKATEINIADLNYLKF